MDLKELQQQYGLSSPAKPETKENTEKPKFSKRRDWLADKSTINSNTDDLKTIENVENNDLISIENIEIKHLNKNINNFSIENKQENKYLKTIEVKKEAVYSLERIVGLQKEALLLIHEHCQLIGSRTTRPLGIAYFVERLKTSQLNAHNVLNELVKKKVIVRADFQRGRGGWSKWEIIETIWNEIGLNSYSIIKNDRKNIEQTIETALSSNSIKDLKINTNTHEQSPAFEFEVPENLKTLGIGSRQLVVIVREGFLTCEEVQQSLEHYSHDVGKGLVKKSNNFFFGILRNKTPYISSQFAQDEAKAVQAEIARIKQIQSDRAELAELQLREQFEDYKLKNPSFLEEIKSGNQFLKSSSPKILDEIAFGKFKELINTQSQNPTP